uniref:Deoxythymidylate kinase n=1 Tax=Gopherus evgoodei TaxID=1825980 RepID=A0A8C4YS60_9SAUR
MVLRKRTLVLPAPVSSGVVTVVARAALAMACRRGALVVLEGVDRTGKTTQSRRLVEALRASGHLAELLRFPDRTTEIGRLISSYLENKSNLEDHTVHLLFSANRWEQVREADTCLWCGNISSMFPGLLVNFLCLVLSRGNSNNYRVD